MSNVFNFFVLMTFYIVLQSTVLDEMTWYSNSKHNENFPVVLSFQKQNAQEAEFIQGVQQVLRLGLAVQ